MIYLSVIFMILARFLNVLHDLYFWGTMHIREFVVKIGWHNIKLAMLILLFESGFILGFISHGTIKEILQVQFAMGLIAWGSFEMLYNILNKDCKLFDWFREFKTCIKHKDGIECILHNVCRLHWIEAAVVLIFGLYLIWRL